MKKTPKTNKHTEIMNDRHGNAIKKNTEVEILVLMLIKEEKQNHRDIVRVEKWEKQMHKQKQ
jgi:hypothetical protein